MGWPEVVLGQRGVEHHAGAARARLPGSALQGNLDPTVCLAPWDVVAREAGAVLDANAGRPGHVFNLGWGVLPETDPDILRRLVDFVHGE